MTEPEQTDRPSLMDEIEHGSSDYTEEELFEQASLNVQALFLGTVQVLKGLPEALDSWRAGLAAVFLRGWELERTWLPEEILDSLLTNYLSFGAHLVDVNLDAEPPTAVIGGLPDLDLVDSLGLDAEHIHELFEIGKLIARGLGGSLAWDITNDTGDIELRVSDLP